MVVGKGTENLLVNPSCHNFSLHWARVAFWIQGTIPRLTEKAVCQQQLLVKALSAHEIAAATRRLLIEVQTRR